MTNMIYALVGPHASGKSTLISQLMSMGVHFIKTYTTNEFLAHSKNPKQAKLFNIVTRDEFEDLDLLVQYSYKGEYYGISKIDILNSLENYSTSVLLLEANGIKQLNKLIKKNLATIFLMVDYVTLVDRMLHMNYSNEEIKYHLQYAENNKEFDNWKLTTHVIKNTGDLKQTLLQLLAIMNLLQPLPAASWQKRVGQQPSQ